MTRRESQTREADPRRLRGTRRALRADSGGRAQLRRTSSSPPTARSSICRAATRIDHRAAGSRRRCGRRPLSLQLRGSGGKAAQVESGRCIRERRPQEAAAESSPKAKYEVADASEKLDAKPVDLSGVRMNWSIRARSGSRSSTRPGAWSSSISMIPNMHGLDWQAVRARYEPLLEFVQRREDLNDLLVEMIGEMQVGHNRISGGDLENERPAGHRTARRGLQGREQPVSHPAHLPRGPLESVPGRPARRRRGQGAGRRCDSGDQRASARRLDEHLMRCSRARWTSR